MDHSKRTDTAKRGRGGGGGSERNKKWSELLSPEARIAMQLALEDTKAMKEAGNEEDPVTKTNSNNNNKLSSQRVAFVENTASQDVDQPAASEPAENPGSREPSYTELYERSGSSRMRRDVTDESYSEESELKRALGGGKVESAMEIVEIVNHDAVDDSLDDKAIEELAKINSVDKCAVWIEATQAHQKEQLANIPEAEHESKETES